MSRRFLLLFITVFLMMSTTSFSATVPRMSTDELKTRLGEEGLVILDVRSSYHWNSSDIKIPGSVRVAPSGVAEWAGNYTKDQAIVLYCA